MARPVDADPQATRARILLAARTLFADRGRDGTTVREVAREARVSQATVRRYYGGRDDLYQACLESLYVDVAQLRRQLEPAALAGGDVAGLVEAAVRTSFRFARDHRDGIRILMRGLIAQGSPDGRRREQYQRPLLERGALLVAAVTGYRPERARLLLQSVIHLVVRYALSSPDELALFTGQTLERLEGEDAAAVEARLAAAVEDHLVDVAQRMLGAEPQEGAEGDP